MKHTPNMRNIWGDVVLPNVGYCVDKNEVYYNPYVKPFFCKLTLNDDSVIELEGSGEFTQQLMTRLYKSTLVSAEIGKTQALMLMFSLTVVVLQV